jgi:hypothetical protein
MANALPPVLPNSKHLSLVEAIDRVLNKGAVIAGDVTISVADIDLVRLDLQIVLAATETLLSLGGDEPKLEQRET